VRYQHESYSPQSYVKVVVPIAPSVGSRACQTSRRVRPSREDVRASLELGWGGAWRHEYVRVFRALFTVSVYRGFQVKVFVNFRTSSRSEPVVNLPGQRAAELCRT